jgi:hypothetical protein
MTDAHDVIRDPMEDPHAPWHAQDVPAEGHVRVWFNEQDFIDWEETYVDSIYVDNNIAGLSIQPDVWTLEIDNEPLNLWYAGGYEYRLLLGSILDTYDGPSRLLQLGNGLVVATDHSLQPMFNAFSTPRLAWIRHDLHRRIQEIAAERLELALLVNQFASIIANYGSLDRTATTALKGPLGT